MTNMSKIAIINLKGGVGKSVTACNLACILAEVYSRRILVVDLDKQANSTKFFNCFGDSNAPTMADVLMLQNKMTDVIQHTEFPNVDIAPSNMSMLLANKNVMIDVRRPQADRIKNALEPLRSEYDYCLFAVHRNDDPIGRDKSVDGLTEIMDQVRDVQHGYNRQLEVMGVLATKYDRGRYSMQTINQIANLDLPTFRNEDGSILRINYSVKVKEAKAAHKPLHRYTPNIPSSAQYKKLAELVKKIAEGE